jgi:hypothetical protein
MRKLAAALALAVWLGCVSVSYPRAGDISPRTGESLVFGRLRFFHDEREFFPWNVTLFEPGVGTRTERHIWLMRLGRRAVSTEVHPDRDGSLALWLASGDYALLGSTELYTSGLPPYEVVALFRVPDRAVATYVGELSLKTESHEGLYLSHGEFGAASVVVLPIDVARVTLEQRLLGTLPEAPVVSPWCAGESLPGFNDSQLVRRARDLLDRGCAAITSSHQ